MKFPDTLWKDNALGRQGRILIYLLALNGGAGKNAISYANELAGRGYAVQLLCGNVLSEALVEALTPEVEVESHQVSRSLLMIPYLVTAIRKHKPDLITVLGASNFLPLNIACAIVGDDSVIVLREANSPSGLLQSYGFWKRMIKRLAFASAFKRADYVIALTQAMRLELEQDWRVPPNRTSVIYNGVTVSDRIEPRAVDTTIPTILCIARLTSQKDLPTLLRAFAIVLHEYPSRLQIAGNGREHGRLVELTSQLGIADNVEFLGHVADVQPLYSHAAVTVLSSRFEGFPNVLVESLAEGCPIVATNCPTGPAEIITGPEIGLLVEMGNVDDLAEKLLVALNTSYDPELLIERAAFFSKANMSEALDAVVTKLLSKTDSSQEHQKCPRSRQ